MAIRPYLNFGGNCREAFTRYQEVFGGDLALMPMSDMPPQEGFEAPPGSENLIMHAALTWGDNILMGSDTFEQDFGPVQGMSITFQTPDAAEAERVFNALAEGGKVDMPFGPTFWSPAFGMCRDRFGTPWMVDTEAPEQSGG